MTPTRRSALDGIGTVGRVLKNSVAEIMEAFVYRLSVDAGVPEARDLPAANLEDHGASLLIDIAQTLIATAETDVDIAALLTDGSEIQRTISVLHGAQRARHAWAEDALEREFRILGEEVESAVRRNLPDDVQADSGLALALRALDQARDISLAELRARQ